MMRILVSIFLIATSTSAFADNLDAYTGYWVGYGYRCFDAHGAIVRLDETVDITRHGNRLTATKVDGDDCVGDGEVTWSTVIPNGHVRFGVNYSALSRVGSPSGRRQWLDGTIKFITSNEIKWQVNGLKASSAVVFKRKSLATAIEPRRP